MKKSNRLFTTESYIEHCISIHGDKFDYSKVVFVNMRTKVLIGYKGEYLPILPDALYNPNYNFDTIQFATDLFIEKSIKIHGYQYDYSRVVYINNSTPISIGYEGKFYDIIPAIHLRGSKIIINKRKKYDVESFKTECSLLYNNKYDYSQVDFKILKDKIKIICTIHGEYYKQVFEHLDGIECKYCNKENKEDKSAEYIEKFNVLHNNRYKYSGKIENNRTVITITCPIHGEFPMTPNVHLSGCGCKKCGYIKNGLNKRIDHSETIEKFNLIHNNYYDYSKYKCSKSDVKSIIICPIHGEFPMTPNTHLSGCGCKKCGYIKNGENSRTDSVEFFEKCKITHYDKYDYSKAVYNGGREDIIIGCPVHGYFTQNAQVHSNGSGCSRCNESKGEKAIHRFLKENYIDYLSEHTFYNCRYKLPLPFDFYLPSYNLCIEFDGIQHYEETGRGDPLSLIQLRDSIKTNYCLENSIELLRIPYYDLKKVPEILNKNLNICINIKK